MAKMIPLSIVIASVVVPMLLADRPRPKRSVRLLQLTMAVLTLLWAVLCMNVYPRYVFPE